MNHHEVPRDENVTGIPSNESKFQDFLGKNLFQIFCLKYWSLVFSHMGCPWASHLLIEH